MMLLVPGMAHAQSPPTGAIAGQVIDAESDVPLAGANIRVEGLGGDSIAGTATDLDGAFRVPLPVGRYLLTASYVGYTPWSDSVATGAPPLVIRLSPGSVQVNPITISASRRPERLLDAPAAVTILEPRELQSRTALTASTHLSSVPGVDIINTGLNQSRVVIRGFNDNLASSLLTLVDHRIARAPSVRLTAMQLIPLIDGDMEQIEVVSGPASALYGPNAANGVVHMMTRSPFDAPGAAVSVAGGQQDVMLASVRYAARLGTRWACKASGQYYSGRDFEFTDPLEVVPRDFDVKNLALSGRVDFRPRPGMSFILNGGLTQGTNVEITPTGAAQVNGARLAYGQLRFTQGRFFAQAYTNRMNSGDSFFLRTGEAFLDKSRLNVLQVQHNLPLGARHHLTWGADLFLTFPEGEGTVNGRNEDRDNTREIGVYAQSETRVTRRLQAVAAARLDHHNHLEKVTFSPRAALVFKPTGAHTLRATWNLAFATPKPNDLFSDVLGLRDVFTLGRMEPLLGFRPETNLRVQGMVDGFSVVRSANGQPRFRSPFARLDPRGLGETDWIDLNDPVFMNVMWEVARASSVAGLADNLEQLGQIPAGSAASVSAALERILPTTVQNVRNSLQLLDLNAKAFQPVSDARDYSTLDVTRTRTIELGYKGLLGRGLIAQIDLYHSNVRNFLGPFVVGTPNVFLESASLKRELDAALGLALQDPSNAEARAALLPLDTLPLVGNGDGNPAQEAAFLISTGVASAIPFGTVSAAEAYDPTAVLLVRQNFGDLDLWGADMNLLLFLSPTLRVGLMYCHVSENWFPGEYDLSLNAPRHKMGGQVSWDRGAFSSNARLRFVDAFRVKSDVYEGTVDAFFVMDASVSYTFRGHTRANLTVQNVLDNRHREFVFVPELGRVGVLRLTHEF
jgi:iron complex outermembrane receptor protein